MLGDLGVCKGGGRGVDGVVRVNGVHSVGWISFVIPAKPAPASLKPGAGIQASENKDGCLLPQA